MTPRHDRRRVQAAAIAKAHAAGCTCAPTVTLNRVGNVYFADLAHDPSCRLLLALTRKAN